MMMKKHLYSAGLAISLLFTSSLMVPTLAAAAQSIQAGKTVTANYDLSVPGTLLVYKNELSQGGMDLSANAMTTDPQSADIAINGRTIGAGSIIDLGKVDFNSVTSLPDKSFTYETDLYPSHVYIVSTHDNRYAKILVNAVLTNKVAFTYAYFDPSSSSSSNGSSSNGSSSSGSSSNDKIIKTVTVEDGKAFFLQWGAVSGAAGYDIYRSDNGAAFGKLNDSLLTSTTFTDSNFLVGHTYLYQIVSNDGSGNVLAKSNLIQVNVVPTVTGQTLIPSQDSGTAPSDSGSSGGSSSSSQGSSDSSSSMDSGSSDSSSSSSQGSSGNSSSDNSPVNPYHNYFEGLFYPGQAILN